MNKFTCFFMIFFLSFFMVNLGAQELLTPLRLVELIEENNSGLEISRKRKASALTGLEINKAAYRPVLTLGLDPGYSLSNQVYQDMTGDRVTSLTQSAGLSLSMGWLTPTGAALSVGVSDNLALASTGETSALVQSPLLSLSLVQPVFRGGKFIDIQAYRSGRRQALELPKTIAEMNHRGEVNSLLAAFLSDYYDLLLLEESYTLKEQEVALARRELEHMNSLKERGLLSGTDFWNKQLEAEQGEDALLEQAYQLFEARQDLASSLGNETWNYTLPSLSWQGPVPGLPGKEDLFAGLIRSYEAEQLRLNNEMVRLSGQAGGDQKSTDLTLSLTASPQYAPDRESSDELAPSFTDLNDKDAWVETTLSVGLSFSPSYWAANKKISERNILDNETARLEWEEKIGELEQQLQSLLDRDEMLKKKLNRIEESLALLERLWEKETKLLELSSSTPLAVEKALLNVNVRRWDAKSAYVDYCRNRLEILRLGGANLADLDFRDLPGGKG